MAIDEAAFAAELRLRHGVTTRTRLRRLGLTDRMIDGMIARGRLVSHGRGVLSDPAAPETLEHRMALACALTSGVICFPTAGVVGELCGMPRPPVIHVAVDWANRRRGAPGIVVHRTRHLPACDIVRRRDGISVTSPPRTVVDAAAWVGAEDVESMIEQCLDRRTFTIPTLWSVTRPLVASARRGSTMFARVLAGRPTWQRPARSDHELRLERAMRRRGFPELVREHPIEILPGVIVHPDLGLPADGFYVEVDHLSWHGGRIQTAYDRWRDTKVRKAGFHVERVTDIALDHHLDETVEDLWDLWQRHRGNCATPVVAEFPH